MDITQDITQASSSELGSTIISSTDKAVDNINKQNIFLNLLWLRGGTWNHHFQEVTSEEPLSWFGGKHDSFFYSDRTEV